METKHLTILLILLLVCLGFTSYYSNKANYSLETKSGMAYTFEEDKNSGDEIEENKDKFVETAVKQEQILGNEDIILGEKSYANEAYIEIKDLKFIPGEINITAGTTVIWINEDFIGTTCRQHIVASHSNYFRSARLECWDKFNFTFAEPGVYTYMDPIYKTSAGGLIIKFGTINVNSLEE